MNSALKKCLITFTSLLFLSLSSCAKCSYKYEPEVEKPAVSIDRSIEFESNTDIGVFKSTNINGTTISYNVIGQENNNLVFQDGSKIYNTSAIKGITKAEVKVTGTASFYFTYGFEADSLDFVSKTFTDTKTYDFNNDFPSYFSLRFTNDNTKVEYIKVYADLKDHPNPFHKVPNNPNITLDEHTYNTKETVEFPSFPVTEGLSYHLSDDGTYYIVDNINNSMVVGSDGRIVFPSEHNGLPVKVIGHLGFLERWWIFEIYVPRSIVSIDNEAFSLCGLTKVYWDAENCQDFPARNAIFNPGDERGHQNIDLVFGPHVKRIPARLMLPSMMTPNVHPKVNSISFDRLCEVTSIGEYAFYGLENISRIDIPNTVTSIEQYAFYGCGLKELDLPNIETIGNSAFKFNESLEHVRLPNNLNTLGEEAFSGCSKLIDIDLHSTSINSIGFGTFKNCTSLKHVLLPDNLSTLSESAFENCTSLLEALIPNPVLSIGVRSFYNCSSITFICLNKALKDIGNEAFSGCNKVEVLVINSSSMNDLELNNKAFINFGVQSLKVYLTSEVAYVPSNLFYGTSLEERLPHIANLYLYSRVITFGNRCFFGQSDTQVEYYSYASDVSNWNKGTDNDILNNVKARVE